jgi:HD-GYP domain-containing protein (c-di-GMP phosphodiesterase class II)
MDFHPRDKQGAIQKGSHTTPSEGSADSAFTAAASRKGSHAAPPEGFEDSAFKAAACDASAPRQRPCAEQRESWSPETAWDVLEHFAQSLQRCEQSRQQIKLVLDSVRASLAADVVFWHPGDTNDSFEILSRDPASIRLPVVWYRDFMARLFAEEQSASGTREGQILRTNLPANSMTSFAPAGAVLVRISRSHDSWLGAVNFHRGGPLTSGRSEARSFDRGDLKVLLLARRILLNHRQQVQVQERLRDSLFGLVRCLTGAIDAKDPYTGGHSERVARIAVRIGREMNLADNVLSDLYLAGLLHDIGKIGIRDSVLLKRGELTDEERLHIREHVLIGDRLVSVVEPLRHLRPGVRNHHERWDGAGYPDGLAGEQIPLLARLLAVADSCDAMMAARPYRSGMAPSQIDSIMTTGAGAQWDPEIIQHFLACRRELYSICQRGLGDSVISAVDRVLERARPHDDSILEKSLF